MEVHICVARILGVRALPSNPPVTTVCIQLVIRYFQIESNAPVPIRLTVPPYCCPVEVYLIHHVRRAGKVTIVTRRHPHHDSHPEYVPEQPTINPTSYLQQSKSFTPTHKAATNTQSDNTQLNISSIPLCLIIRIHPTSLYPISPLNISTPNTSPPTNNYTPQSTTRRQNPQNHLGLLASPTLPLPVLPPLPLAPVPVLTPTPMPFLLK